MEIYPSNHPPMLSSTIIVLLLCVCGYGEQAASLTSLTFGGGYVVGSASFVCLFVKLIAQLSYQQILMEFHEGAESSQRTNHAAYGHLVAIRFRIQMIYRS